MEREGRCLRSLSSVSKEVRLACLPHLFRRLQYVSANRSTPCLEKYCKNLNSKDIKPYLRFVKIFSIMPLEEGSPRITRVSLCSLCAILKKLPNVETLDLVCFTWKGCRRAHDCLRGMSPLRLHRLEIVHVRVIGPDDPLNMLRIASSVDHFALLDVVPTTHTLNLNTTSLASVPRKSVSVQLLMDSRKLVLPDGVERKAPLYNNHPALSRALRLGLTSTLVDLRVAWGLSHYERGICSCYVRALATEGMLSSIPSSQLGIGFVSLYEVRDPLPIFPSSCIRRVFSSTSCTDGNHLTIVYCLSARSCRRRIKDGTR